MIVPHYDAILHALGTSRENIQGKTDIQIPVAFLKFLLKNVIKNETFNEAGYLAENPDVAAAVKAKKLSVGSSTISQPAFLKGGVARYPLLTKLGIRKQIRMLR